MARKQPFPSPHGGRLVIGLGGFQRFDSLAVDAGGNVCVATLITGCISVIAPDGRLVRQVPTGDPMTTNICFGGPDRRTAFITLSGKGQLVAIDWPEAGAAARARGLTVFYAPLPLLGRAVRYEWTLDPDWLSVNHGSFGATPRVVRARPMAAADGGTAKPLLPSRGDPGAKALKSREIPGIEFGQPLLVPTSM